MNPQTLQEALAEYRDSREKRKQIPTVDEIAERHGTTRQMLLYHANKETPASSDTTGATSDTPEEVPTDQVDITSPDKNSEGN